MTPETVSSVIDKLAEKAGVAVDKLEPLAGRIVEQYVRRSWVFAGFAVMAMVLSAWLVWHCDRRGTECARSKPEADAVYAFGFFVGLIGFLIAAVATVIQAGHALAPLPSMLGL